MPKKKSRRELEVDFATTVNNLKSTLTQLERWFPKDCTNHLRCLASDVDELGIVHDSLREAYSERQKT